MPIASRFACLAALGLSFAVADPAASQSDTCRVDAILSGAGVRVAPCLEPGTPWALRSFRLARADGAAGVRAVAVEQTPGGVRFALHDGRRGGPLTALAEYQAVPSVTRASRLLDHAVELNSRIGRVDAAEAALDPLVVRLKSDLADSERTLADLKAQSEALRSSAEADPAAIDALENAILAEAARGAGLEVQIAGVETNLERTRALRRSLADALAATEAALDEGAEGPAGERTVKGRRKAPALVPEGEPPLDLPPVSMAIAVEGCESACEIPVPGWSADEAFLLRGFAVEAATRGAAFTNLEVRPIPSRRAVRLKFGGAGATPFKARVQYALTPLDSLGSAQGGGSGRNPGLASAPGEAANDYAARMTLSSDAGAEAATALRGFALAFERRPRPLSEIGVLRLPPLGAPAGQSGPVQAPGYRLVLQDDEAVDPVVWTVDYAVLR